MAAGQATGRHVLSISFVPNSKDLTQGFVCFGSFAFFIVIAYKFMPLNGC
jgi:hypothetical protein